MFSLRYYKRKKYFSYLYKLTLNFFNLTVNSSFFLLSRVNSLFNTIHISILVK